MRPAHSWLNWANGIWLAIYLAAMIALVWYLLGLREAQVDKLSSPEAQTAWEDWRNEAAKQDGKKGAVQRRKPKSPEPPSLVLLRDYFPVVMTGSLVFGSALFAMLMFAFRASFAGLFSSERTFDGT